MKRNEIGQVSRTKTRTRTHMYPRVLDNISERKFGTDRLWKMKGNKEDYSF